MVIPDELRIDPLAALDPYLMALPVLPDLVMRLVNLDFTSDDAFDEVVAIAQEDPTFAVRVLALANSAALAPGSQVTSIPQAVTRVGASRIAELVSSIALMDIFSQAGDATRDLWVHAVESAVLCRGLSSLVVGQQPSSAEAYLLGLVHDLGRCVMLYAEAVQPGMLVGFNTTDLSTDEVTASGTLTVERERRCLGFDHAQVGGRVAERIGLDQDLARRIAGHHEPGDDTLGCLLYLAEGLSVHSHLRPELFVVQPPEPAALRELAERCMPPAWRDESPLDLDTALERLPVLLTEAWHLTERLGG